MVEMLIREVWPSLAAASGTATMGRTFQKSLFLAPLGWAVLIPGFLKRLAGWVPGLGGMSQRYRLTNRRLAVFSGFPPKVVREVELEKIKGVRIVTDDNSAFYIAGNIEIIGESGNIILTLPGVPEPQSFKNSVLDAAAAFGPIQNII